MSIKNQYSVEEVERRKYARAYLRINQCILIWLCTFSVLILSLSYGWAGSLQKFINFLWVLSIIYFLYVSISAVIVLKKKVLGAILWITILGILNLGFIPLFQIRSRLIKKLKAESINHTIFRAKLETKSKDIIKDNQEATNSAHESWAENYDEVNAQSFGNIYNQLTIATLELVHKLNGPQRVVDYGAGTGRISLPLSKLGHRVTAVEPSKAMLQVLARKDKDNLVKRYNESMLTFEADEYQDVALAVYTVVSYITEWETLRDSFAKVRRQLKEGGQFIIDVPRSELFSDNNIQRDDFKRVIRFSKKENGICEYWEHTELVVNGNTISFTDTVNLRLWSDDEVIKALSEAGFVNIRSISTEESLSPESVKTLRLSGANYYICKNPIQGSVTNDSSIWDTGFKVFNVILVLLLLSSVLKRCNKKEDSEKSLLRVKDAITRNDSRYLIELGYKFKNGEGVDKIPEQTYRCWSEAAKMGNPDAQVLLAELYLQGFGTESNRKAAQSLAMPHAEKGNSKAQLVLGWSYVMKNNTQEDKRVGLEWLNKAAQKGNIESIILLSFLYQDGVGGVEKNSVMAYKWLKVLQYHDPRNETKWIIATPEFPEDLTSEELAEGDRLADEFIRSYPKWNR